MKKIIAVDVPDGWFISSVHKAPICETSEYFNEKTCQFTELTPPTEEEISLEADKYYMAIPKSEPKRNCDISFIRGANWMLKQLGL